MKRISVIGAGRLGLAFALLCDRAGYEVMGSDKRADYIQLLKDKALKTPEPHIEEMLKKATRFYPTTNNKDAINFSDLVFVFVATPSKEDGEYDHQYIEEVVTDVIDCMQTHDGQSKTLIISCTTMPTYCKSLQEKFDLLGLKVNVLYNPEFIAQGDIIAGLRNADIILIGGEYYNPDISQLYRDIMSIPPVFKMMSLTAAEITKIAINCYLTMKISFANMIGEIAINSGEKRSVTLMLDAIGSDLRIGSKYLKYGFGFAGVCLPRDNRALGIHAFKSFVSHSIPDTIDGFNESHFYFIKRRFMIENPDKNIPFVFNQLSYKKGVDILTDSQHYRLCKELLEEGYRVHIVESDAIIKMVQPELSKYGDRVVYENNNGQSRHEERVLIALKQRGFVIEL